MTRLCGTLAVLTTLAAAPVVPLVAQGTGPSTGGLVALDQERRMIGHTRRALMIGAHPDDEDTEVLTILGRGQGVETAYLALNRGEGGQNLIGPELGEGLGVIRTGELLGARAVDGGRQFFTRSYDYGFSKTLEEAWRFWPRDSVLKDVVRIIRRFQPQIVIAVFTGTPRDGHGQHQAAGWAAAEAFRVAGDPTVFPELEREEGLAAFSPLKLFRARPDSASTTVVLDGGALDPALGQSFRQLAMRSRSLHRSQDQGSLQEIGPSVARLALVEDRTRGGPGLWDGIDTSAVPDHPDQVRHRSRIRAIEAGLVFDLLLDDARVVPGQEVTARVSAWNAGTGPVTVTSALEGPLAGGIRSGGECLRDPAPVAPGRVRHCSVVLRVPEGARWSVPYYLDRERQGAFHTWGGNAEQWGLPFEADPLSARFTFRVGAGPASVLTVEARHRSRDQAFGEVRRPIQVVPRVGVLMETPAAVWVRGGGPQAVIVTLQHGGRDSTSGTLSLELPPGWDAVPARRFTLDAEDGIQRHRFEVRAPAAAPEGRYEIHAVARTQAGERFTRGMQAVEYPHVEPRLLPRPAVTAVQLTEVVLPALERVGYVRGASDLVPEALRAVGVPLELLDPGALAQGDLSRYDVIVIGSRAYEIDPVLVEQTPRLLEWVRGGGRLVVQYQQQAYFGGGHAPYPLALAPRGHDRVTDEGAAVALLRPDAAPFQAPNRLGEGDWAGWIQERGLYFPRTWDPAWTSFLAMHDPGEEPLEGGLLAARLGQGTYIYTGLSFFRQLPAAVPGALRLFLNLLGYTHHALTP